MEQTPRYINDSNPHHVCHLKKAIYGLKKGPREWFHQFSIFLLNIGFNCSQLDSSLFFHSLTIGILYLLL